jgi:hypothetical protein
LQPDEPAADYQLFTAWLQLPVPRSFPKAAVSLHCSVHRLRRLSRQHNWKTRAAAFDQHRAHAASRALDQLLSEETSSCKERAERFRLQEWLLHEEMLEAAFSAVRELQKHPRRASLADVAKLLDLVSTLGRRASGLPLDPATVEPDLPRPRNPEAEAALNKIYDSDEYKPKGPMLL